MAKNSRVRVTASTGNLFRDIGFSRKEAEHLVVRADLLIQRRSETCTATGERLLRWSQSDR
jgi:hypothetical protein